jgi:hypothetical protein
MLRLIILISGEEILRRNLVWFVSRPRKVLVMLLVGGVRIFLNVSYSLSFGL